MLRFALVQSWFSTPDLARPHVALAAWGAAQDGGPEPRRDLRVLEYADLVSSWMAVSGRQVDLSILRSGDEMIAGWMRDLYPSPAAIEGARDFSDAGQTSGPA
jgi:hypothetical protein